MYHDHCLSKWLKTRQNSPTCPICCQTWKISPDCAAGALDEPMDEVDDNVSE